MTREEAIAYYKKNAIRIKGIMAEEDETLKDRFSQTLEATDMAIKALEQEPCEDAINREAVIEQINEWCDKEWGYTNATEYLHKRIKALPNITPKEKTGHWIGDNQAFYIYAKCSECGSVHDTATNYCPECGCLMDRTEFDEYVKTEGA